MKAALDVIDKLDHLVDNAANQNSKLVLLVGLPRTGKSALLDQLAERRKTQVINVSVKLGRQLASVPVAQRPLRAGQLLRGIIDETTHRGILIMDNIELLFDKTLELNPLKFLQQHSHEHCVVAAWPGEIKMERLTYAVARNPEYRSYATADLALLDLN